MNNSIIKEQFNKQAEKYANWSIAKNVKNLNGYFDFCRIRPSDRVLDVACGPGDFMIYISRMISVGRGVDISDREIEIAKNHTQNLGLSNILFDCSDVEHLPYEDKAFSVVVCRYAFHHFTNPDATCREMVRCCETGGKICLLDIASYKDDYVNEFFERFDKLVDISHNKTMNEVDFNRLYDRYGIDKTREITIEVDLDVNEYISHAFQDRVNRERLDQLLREGQEDKRLAKFLFVRDGGLYFKRHVYLMVGKPR